MKYRAAVMERQPAQVGQDPDEVRWKPLKHFRSVRKAERWAERYVSGELTGLGAGPGMVHVVKVEE